MLEAVGFIEVNGLTAALVAGDAAAKAADIEIIALDSTKPQNGNDGIPLTVVVKITGDVASVKAAVEAGGNAARKYCKQVITHVIARGDQGITPIVRQGNVGKNK